MNQSWKIFKGTRDDVHLGGARKADRFYGVLNEDGFPIVEVHMGSPGQNLRLIVAAPELLGELEIAVDVIESFIEDSPEAVAEPIQALLASMKNVINKAKGE